MAEPVCDLIEDSLCPSPDVIDWNDGELTHSTLSTGQKVVYYTKKFLPAVAVASAVVFASLIYSIPTILAAPFVALAFKCVRSLSERKVEHFDMKEEIAFSEFKDLPRHFGFADSLFQSNGLGTKASATPLEGTCNWDEWLTKEHIEMKDGQQFPTFFVDYLDDPTPLIRILKEMNVTAYRFSLERSVIESTPGKINLEAVNKYRNLFKKLKDNGIEPWVTLHHFVEPKWFSDKGGFEKLENVDDYVRWASEMIRTFPEIEYWMTFNEPGVYAFQGYIRGVYPPGKEGDFETAGVVMRNLMIAHCKIYKEVKDNSQIYGNVKVGITHQWLKFLPFNSCNPISRFVCCMLSKITHDVVFDFFKTGKFSFQMPGKANIQLKMNEEEWKAENWIDFIGVQSYGFPRLMALDWNYGEEYPGYKIENYTNLGLSFGSTCPEKGGKVLSFGPPFAPEDLDAVLTEAEGLGVPIAITETGCDAKVKRWGEKEFTIDTETQKEYFERILPIIAKHKESCIALFMWTWMRGNLEDANPWTFFGEEMVKPEELGDEKHLEWERGGNTSLGIIPLKVEQDPQNEKIRRIVNAKHTEGSKYLQKAFAEKKESMRERRSSALAV